MYKTITNKLWEFITCLVSNISLKSEIDIKVKEANDLKSDNVYLHKEDNTFTLDCDNVVSHQSISLIINKLFLQECNNSVVSSIKETLYHVTKVHDFIVIAFIYYRHAPPSLQYFFKSFLIKKSQKQM